MKKICSNLFAVTLILSAAFSIGGCAGCKSKTDSKNEQGADGSYVNETDNLRRYVVKETEGYIIENGQSDYKIVLPANATEVEEIASEELATLVEESTGVSLPVIDDSSVSYTPSAKYISLGATNIFTQSGASYKAEELGEAGFIIQTKGNSLILSGAEEYGTLYAVYEFLNQALDFEQYTVDMYSLNKNVTNVPLMDYDVQDVPDFDYRATLYSSINGTQAERRMRLRGKNEIFIKSFNNTVSNHNAFKYVDPNIYNNPNFCTNQAEHECINDCMELGEKTIADFPDCVAGKYHPDWFATGEVQLCYLAHGNETEQQALFACIGDQIIQQLLDNPSENIIHLGHADNTLWCTCEACRSWNDIYHANSASVINMCNNVREYVENYFKQNNIQREWYITFFAYYGTNAAPVEYNKETGEYSPINGLRCADGVYVYWADTNVNYQESIYSESNLQYYRSLKGWEVLSDKIFIWSYNTNFHFFLAPFDSFNTMQEFYQFVDSVGVSYFYDQGQDQFGGSTGFSALKIYLTSKLAWNVNADVEALTRDFFENVYGIVSNDMLALFNDFRLHCAVIEKAEGFGGNNAVFENPINEAFWSENTLKNWVNRLDSMLKKIQSLKDEQSEYQRLYKQIIMERIAYNYLRIEIYSNSMTDEELLALKLQTKEDIELVGMHKFSEKQSISTLFASWGV